MDALLALIFAFTLVVSGIVLFVTLWVGSVALLISPRRVADHVVLRFWPERLVNEATLRRYRFAGGIGLLLATTITWQVLLEVLPG